MLPGHTPRHEGQQDAGLNHPSAGFSDTPELLAPRHVLHRHRANAELLRNHPNAGRLRASGSLKRAAEGAGHGDEDASSDKTGDQIADPTAAERNAEEAH
jgi:hypothetical protein